jgi:hypothetical protein
MGVAGGGYSVSGEKGGEVHRRTVTTMIPGRRLQVPWVVAAMKRSQEFLPGFLIVLARQTGQI